MKGRATIEFYKDDKLIYKKIHNNMITNGVNNLVNQNYVVNGITNNGGRVETTYTPIWKNFAGLMLFTRNIDESVIIPTKDVITYFTGNGTDIDHFDSANVYHGYFDASTSKIDKEKLDLQFVFPLNSVAGDIGSICLTSIMGGNNGLANGSDSILVSYSDQNLQSGNGCGVGLDVPSANYIPYINHEIDGQVVGINPNGDLVTIKEVDETHITIKTYKVSTKVNFTDTFYKVANLEEYNSVYGGTLDNLPMLTKVGEETIELINGYDSVLKFNLIDNFLYIPKYDAGTFYLYRVNLEDFTISYQNTSVSIENIRDYKNVEDKLYITTDTYLYMVNLSEYKENQYLFENTYDRIEVLEDNLTPIIFKDTISLLNTTNITQDEERNIYFLTNTNVLNKNKIVFNGSCDNIVSFCFNFNEPCMGVITQVGDVSTININVFTSYLATINNINVATKYATVVMKVLYELYTDDYEEK